MVESYIDENILLGPPDLASIGFPSGTSLTKKSRSFMITTEIRKR